jgi:hypothetical protein
MSFYAAVVNADGSVWLRYDVFDQQTYRASLYIYEKNLGNSAPPPLTVGASANIIQTQVATISGPVPAEYVQGDWTVSPSFTQPPGNSVRGETHNIWNWENGSNSQRLRWQQNDVFVALYYQPYRNYSAVIGSEVSNPEWTYLNTELRQADVLQIASGMLPYSKMNTSRLSLFPVGAHPISINMVRMGSDQIFPDAVDKTGINHPALIAMK